jgi:hypothetical protein
MTPMEIAIEGHIGKAYVINFEIENKKIIQRLI